MKHKPLVIAGVVLAVLLVAGVGTYAFMNRNEPVKMLGIVTTAADASLDVKDQPGATTSILVDSFKAPDPSWIVVHLDVDGKPGKRVGLLSVPAGVGTGVSVTLTEAPTTDKVIVAVHGDKGTAGTFDFDMEAFAASPDKPYFIDGMELAVEVQVR